MTRRLYLPPPLTTGPHPLASDREHYLKNVLRVKEGTRVEVFDGAGTLAQATVQRDGRKLALQIEHIDTAAPTSRPRLHLGFALLKAKAMEQVLRKATELGATDLWPLYTDHTHVPRKLLASANSEHAQSIIISACEQCGQNRLPQLHPGMAFDALLAQPPAHQLFIADLNAERFPSTLPRQDSMVLIGPEGGWSDRERNLATEHGAVPVKLGELVLRAETAPIVALTLISTAWVEPNA